MLLIFLALLSGNWARLIIGSSGQEYSAPYDMPRIIPSNFAWNVTGELTFNASDAYGKIYAVESGDIIDTVTLRMQKAGALGVIFTSQGIGVTLPGRRVSEFENQEFFSIPAVEIGYEDYLELRNSNTTLTVRLEYENNSWTDMFRSGSFISYKVIRGIICLFILTISVFLLIKLSSRRDMKPVVVSMSLMLGASLVFLSSLIDQFGQDQLFPSKASVSFFTLGNAIVDVTVWLYVIIMMELLKDSAPKGTRIIKNKWAYISIAIISFSIEVIFICLSIAVDPNSGSLNLLQLVGYVIRMLLRISLGLLYLISTARLYRYVMKIHPEKNDKIRVRTRYTFMFNWILGVTLVIRGFFTATVIFLLGNPFTYTVFFWVEMLLTSLVMICLVLSPFFNYYKAKALGSSAMKTSSGSVTSMTIEQSTTNRGSVTM